MTLPFLATTAVGIVSALARRLPFLPWWISYTDVWKFFRVASLPGWPYAHISLEYPPLIGVFIRSAGVLGGTQWGYYLMSIAGLTLCAAVTAYVLFNMIAPDRRSRVWLFFIFAPTLVLFLAMNWDAVAVMFATLALYAVSRNRYVPAALWIALGASAKLYPLLFLPFVLLAEKTWMGRTKIAGAFAAAWAVINVPFMIANFEGWSYFLTFNQLRHANFDSLWTFLRFIEPAITPATVSGISLTLFAIAYLAILIAFRGRNVIVSSFLATLAFILTNKVFSPQYLLWLLPFFALLPVFNKKEFYTLEVANILIFFSILRWLDSVRGIGYISNAYLYLSLSLVVLRHILLAVSAVRGVRLARRPANSAL